LEDKDIFLAQTIEFVKSTLANAEGGHDWWHIYRVWNTAKQIARYEQVDMFIVEMGALLHDIADSKFNNGDEEIGPQKARIFLESIKVKESDINHIEKIISNISFKGGQQPQNFQSPELNVVQDADRLDALGAIGIARTFNYGGHKGREIYNPAVKPNIQLSKEEYKNSKAPTLNHFYEKLLLLKDRMNTEKGKEMAHSRHDFMLAYLNQFYSEWEGEK
jgi:uncharacterized protein